MMGRDGRMIDRRRMYSAEWWLDRSMMMGDWLNVYHESIGRVVVVTGRRCRASCGGTSAQHPPPEVRLCLAMDGKRQGRGRKVDWYDCDSVVTECGADGREVTKVVQNWREPGRRRNVVKGQPKRSSAYP